MKTLPRAAFIAGTLAAGGGMVFLGRRMATPKPPPKFPPESLVVAVLPVGQGEASWIKTPDDHFIVIGCGPDIGGRELANSLRSVGAQRIDLLIMPTPYRESLGGVPDLVRAFPITMAYDNGWVEPLNQAHKAAFRSLGENGIPIFSAEAGQSITVGGGTLEFLHPSEPRILRSPEAGNNAVVVRLVWGKTVFLWAGGIQREGEEALLSRSENLSANWLRVARFGTREASSPEWLRAVSPEYAVISSGPGRDGYPHPETLERLQAAGVRLMRTDEASEPLLFFSDGETVTTP